jgi:hypothetical protein
LGWTGLVAPITLPSSFPNQGQVRIELQSALWVPNQEPTLRGSRASPCSERTRSRYKDTRRFALRSAATLASYGRNARTAIHLVSHASQSGASTTASGRPCRYRPDASRWSVSLTRSSALFGSLPPC